jgi:hypothetical protein
MSWRFGSLSDLRGEWREGGLVLCLEKRGEPEELRGDSGGVLLLRNTEGKFLDLLVGVPDLASSIKDLTYRNMKNGKPRSWNTLV